MILSKQDILGTSLVVQWLRLCSPNDSNLSQPLPGSILGPLRSGTANNKGILHQVLAQVSLKNTSPYLWAVF